MRASGRKDIKLHFDKNEIFASVPETGKCINIINIEHTMNKINTMLNTNTQS